MTDKKEIIVHGVDVSECEKLAPYNGYDEETKCNPSCCQNSPNCMFKQLKRKEQECEKLKKVNSELIRYLLEIFEALDIDTGQFLLGRNLEFYAVLLATAKNKIKEYKQTPKEFQDNCKGCDTCKEALNNSREYAWNSLRYEQALKKIEEIVTELPCDGISSCMECNENCEHKDILNIINKAKGQ